MKIQRILLTGSSGFLGGAIHSELCANAERLGIKLVPWTRELDGSLLSRDDVVRALDSHGPHTVIHFAWHPTHRPGYEFDVENHAWEAATLTLVEECATRDIWLICAGSAVENEDAFHLSGSPYARSKRSLRSKISHRLVNQSTISWLQIQYVFSLEARRPRLLDSLLSATDKQTFQPDSPESKHDFINLADVAKSLVTLVEHRIAGVIVIGSGHLFTTANLVNAAKFNLGISKNRQLCKPSNSHLIPSVLLQKGWRPSHTYAFFGLTEDEFQI